MREHKHSVLIAACDTFRSGAVEQLEVHASALGVPLYQRGYQKDSALIAKDGMLSTCSLRVKSSAFTLPSPSSPWLFFPSALVEAKEKGTDVVLIDTAGRMQVRHNKTLLQLV